MTNIDNNAAFKIEQSTAEITTIDQLPQSFGLFTWHLFRLPSKKIVRAKISFSSPVRALNN
jgi:hypothetical protein